MRKSVIIIILLSFFLNSFCQEYIIKLREKLPDYQDFLEIGGFGEVIKTDYLEYLEEDTLVLYLKANFDSHDSNFVAWTNIKNQFYQEKQFDFTEYLFYSACNIFKHEPSKMYVLIFDTYDPLKQPLFYVGIGFDKTKKKVEFIENIKSRSSDSEINIIFHEINTRQISIYKGQKLKNQEEVLDFVLMWSKRYFVTKINTQNTSENNDLAKFMTISNYNGTLKFEVIGLRKNVLNDEYQWISDVIRWTYSAFNLTRKPTEYLKFEIKYSEIGNSYFKLKCSVSGKYGLKNDVNWNTMRNMEPQFTSYLQKYTDEYIKLLYDKLTNQ